MFDSLRVPSLSSQTPKHKPSKGDSSLSLSSPKSISNRIDSGIDSLSLSLCMCITVDK